MVAAADDCADKALDQLGERCDVCRDFEHGFRKAYRDVALGGDGRTPAVPPKKFWQAAHRTEEGHDRARAWFHGYECGAEHAQNDGLQPYRRLATPDDVGPGYERLPTASAAPVASPSDRAYPVVNQVDHRPVDRFHRGPQGGGPLEFGPPQDRTPPAEFIPPSVHNPDREVETYSRPAPSTIDPDRPIDGLIPPSTSPGPRFTRPE